MSSRKRESIETSNKTCAKKERVTLNREFVSYCSCCFSNLVLLRLYVKGADVSSSSHFLFSDNFILFQLLHYSMNTLVVYNQDSALAKNLFIAVRDIPYRIPLKFDDPDNSCHGKSILLNNLLKSYNYNSRIMLCTFKWSELRIDDSCKKFIVKDLQYHYFVELNLDGRWIKLDTTLDSGLKRKIPVNDWDGFSDTRIAVVPIKFLSEDESRKILKSSLSMKYFREKMKSNGRLYKRLNEVYQEIRENQE